MVEKLVPVESGGTSEGSGRGRFHFFASDKEIKGLGGSRFQKKSGFRKSVSDFRPSFLLPLSS